MMEMIARESRESDAPLVYDPDSQRASPGIGDIVIADRVKAQDFASPSRAHSRAGSRVEISESDELSFRDRAGLDSPTKPGRASLEVPSFGRPMSMDYDSSRPTSPELRPSRRDTDFVSRHRRPTCRRHQAARLRRHETGLARSRTSSEIAAGNELKTADQRRERC